MVVILRINPKLFTAADETTPVEVQEFDNRKIEIFNLNDFEVAKEEFIGKGKFAVWSSVDGTNYRVFIEEGYYKELKDLYGAGVNKIWVDFWDTCEKISRRASYRIILPTTAAAILACFLTTLLPSSVSMYIAIAIIVVAFGVMMFANKLTKKKIYEANVDSVDKIKAELGEKNFNKLLDAQKEYMDSYYDALYPEDQVEDDLIEDEDASVKELETVEEVVDETPEEANEESKEVK